MIEWKHSGNSSSESQWKLCNRNGYTRCLVTLRVLSDGNTLAVKGGTIVEKKSIVDFARRPADTYRRLQAAVEYQKNTVS